MIIFSDFSGGLNEALPPERLQANELARAWNVLLGKNTGGLRKRDGVAKLEANPRTVTGKVTSIAQHWVGTDYRVLATSGTDVYRASPAAVGSFSFSSITGALNFPDGNRWTWQQFGDALLGFNGATTASGLDNPVEINGLTGTLSAITVNGGTAPLAQYSASWNRRLWVVDEDLLTVKGTKAGDYTVWDQAGVNGSVSFIFDDDKGGEITSIFVWRGDLYVAKQGMIYVIRAGTPSTDKEQYSRVLVTESIGVVSHWTVQEVLDDIVFLSEDGIRSLSATLTLGSFEPVRVSRKVPAIAGSDLSERDSVASVVDREASLYLCTIRSDSSLDTGTADRCYALDYRSTLAGGLFPQDGGLVGASYLAARVGGVPMTIVGGYDGLYAWDPSRRAFTQREDDVWTSTYTPRTAEAKTAAASGETLFFRKDFWRAQVRYRAETDPVAFGLEAIFDERGWRAQSYSFSLSPVVSGSLLDGPDEMIPTANDPFVLEGATEVDQDVVVRFRGASGRRGQTAQLRFVWTNWDENGEVTGAVIDDRPLLRSADRFVEDRGV